MYITSNNINVFPTTLRESIDPAAKYTTEYNLTSLINKLIDRDAFVIDNDLEVIKKETESSTQYIISNLNFNIMGYYFSIKDINIYELIKNKNSGYIEASIAVSRQSYISDYSFMNWSQLQGTDTQNNGNPYEGLDLNYSNTATFDINNNNKNVIDQAVMNASFTGNIYTFTILEFKKIISEDVDGNQIELYNISIPAKSKIKFETNKDGSHHSVTIDDGELQ